MSRNTLPIVFFSILLIPLVIMSSHADAHVLDGAGAGLEAGFAHPFSGLDHLMAMIAVGLWAAQMGRPALWVLPMAFPVAMALGAFLAVSGVTVPFVESAIAGSVFVLGLVIALAVRPSAPISAAIVVLFAIFHGHAHGTELPLAASPVLYGIGFVIATVMLHGLGIAASRLIHNPARSRALRSSGAVIAAAGILLLIGV